MLSNFPRTLREYFCKNLIYLKRASEMGQHEASFQSRVFQIEEMVDNFSFQTQTIGNISYNDKEKKAWN